MSEENRYAVMPYSDYQETCNAIREQTGTSDLIKSGDMASMIRSIEGGGEGTTGGAVRYDIAQSLTDEQKAQARANIGIVDGNEVAY